MAAASARPILYSYFLSSCSWRVRIALAYKGINYDYKGVDLQCEDHLKEQFLKVNPCGQIPALVVEGNVLTHSTAILEYLEETFPDPPLLPKNPIQAARVREIVDAIACGIQPLQNDKVLKYVGQKSDKWAEHWIRSGFESIERLLQKTHGKYCVGDDVTLADVCLVPQVFRAHLRNVKVSDFKLISTVSTTLSGLNAFMDAHPFTQPDCPTYRA